MVAREPAAPHPPMSVGRPVTRRPRTSSWCYRVLRPRVSTPGPLATPSVGDLRQRVAFSFRSRPVQIGLASAGKRYLGRLLVSAFLPMLTLRNRLGMCWTHWRIGMPADQSASVNNLSNPPAAASGRPAPHRLPDGEDRRLRGVRSARRTSSHCAH